ncbi:MAG: hypothetical protein ACJ71Q_11060 [Terriglobales bacterium]
MMRSKVAGGVLLFFLGMLIGSILPIRSVLAQGKESQEGSHWIIQPIQNARFNAYIFNERTGEIFMLTERDKSLVKLKEK